MNPVEPSVSPAGRAAAFDLFNLPADFLAAPERWWELLREHDPVHRNADGSLLITRYADVFKVWRDNANVVDKCAHFRQKFGSGPLYEHHTTAMLFRDPPDHDRLRATVNGFFTLGTIERLRPAVSATAAELLDSFADGQEIDFVADFAFQITIRTICRMLGVPEADGARIQQYSRSILLPLNPKVPAEVIAAGDRAVVDFKNYLLPHIERVRAQAEVDPGASIISALVAAERAGAEISELELVHMCIQLLNGGHESTTNFISLSMNLLLDRPDKLAEYRALGDDVGLAFDELVRYISPIQLQGRRATRDLEICGRQVPAGTELVFGVAAANRDERQFRNADQLDFARKPNPHIGFGTGVHACIGRPLARLESTIALPAVLRRFARIERAGPAEIAPVIRFRGLSRLPLRLYRE